MKRVFFPLLLVGFALSPLQAQEFVAPTQQERTIAPQPDQRGLSIEGIVAQVFQNPQPWQLLNPLAPASYGSGEKNVSKDIDAPYVNQAGLIVFGVEW